MSSVQTEAARHDAAPPAATPPGQYLRLGVGGEMFATTIDAVREILEVGRLTMLPQTPAFVRGVINLRGAVVPVIDLGARFGQAAAQIGRRSCIVVVEVHGAADDAAQGDPATRQVIGMLVDAVYEVFESSVGELEPVPPMGTSVPGEYLQAMARVRGAVCAVLDLDRLLAPTTLAELIARQARLS
jgi:purine-binding chemotaxis protein CheW